LGVAHQLLDAKGRPYKVWVLQPSQRSNGQIDVYMETQMQSQVYVDRKVWFSMWFLGAVASFGLAFFPMYYRLMEGRNKHFLHEAEFEEKVMAYLKSQGKQTPSISQRLPNRNAKAWAVSIILIIPIFVIAYLLSKDLVVHESNQDAFLATAFPTRIFMPQTIPIKTYVIVTVCTLGVGVIYWLYKVVNLYNAHFKAQMQVEKEVTRLMEEEKVVS